MKHDIDAEKRPPPLPTMIVGSVVAGLILSITSFYGRDIPASWAACTTFFLIMSLTMSRFTQLQGLTLLAVIATSGAIAGLVWSAVGNSKLHPAMLALLGSLLGILMVWGEGGFDRTSKDKAG